MYRTKLCFCICIIAALLFLFSCSSDTLYSTRNAVSEITPDARKAVPAQPVQTEEVFDVNVADVTPTPLISTPTPLISTPAPLESTPTPSPTPSPEPEETPSPAPSPTPEETPSPTPSPTPAETPRLPLSGYVIGIDPGHQRHSNHDTEPNAPGSSVMKAKVSSGTEGVVTHVPEYQVNLDVGLLLRDILEKWGARVVMTRTTNDVDISNIERAQLFNREKTDFAIRLHCDGKDDASVHGAFMLVPTENPYLDDCNAAAEIILDEYCKETGAKSLGITYRSDQTGFNWCERLIVNIEMGCMSNEAEDRNLTSPDYQKKMARGIANGIKSFFEQRNYHS